MTHVVMMMDSPDALGGVQRVLRLLADGLVERGVRTSVVGLVPATVPHRFPTKNELPEFLVHDHDVPLPYSPNTRLRRSRLLARGKAAGVRHFDAGVRRLRGLLADLDDSDDVVVVAHQLRCAEYAVAAGVPKQRLIVEYHDAHSAAEGYHELPRIDRVHRAARVLLTLSDEDTRLFAARGVGPVRTMRNPIDLAALTATAPPQHRDPVVIAAGRHTPQKAYDVLLRAWAQVAPQHPGWRLEIHGDGPDRAALTALVDSLGAPAALLPPEQDLPARMRRAAVHALSSRHEGMGLVIAEAMASGTPTVATDCGPGVRDLITSEETGLLVPTGDVSALATALDRLISDAALRQRLAEAARSTISHHDVDAVVDDWLPLLRHAVPRVVDSPKE